MQVGVSSFAVIRRPLADAERDLVAFGVGVEVMCEPPHAWPAPVPWSNGSVVSLHMPIFGINIASTNPGIREESVRQIESVIREAARLGARGVVVHPGSPPYEAVFPRAQGLPHAAASLERLAAAAGSAGVEIYLENMPALTPAEGMAPMKLWYGVSYEELRELFERVNHPSLRLCLDVGHAYLAGRPVLEALLRDRDVVHVHISDNHGRLDDHLPWGDGVVSAAVDLARDLPPSVRTVICEDSTLDASRTSLARVRASLVDDSQPARKGGTRG